MAPSAPQPKQFDLVMKRIPNFVDLTAKRSPPPASSLMKGTSDLNDVVWIAFENSYAMLEKVEDGKVFQGKILEWMKDMKDHAETHYFGVSDQPILYKDESMNPIKARFMKGLDVVAFKQDTLRKVTTAEQRYSTMAEIRKERLLPADYKFGTPAGSLLLSKMHLLNTCLSPGYESETLFNPKWTLAQSSLLQFLIVWSPQGSYFRKRLLDSNLYQNLSPQLPNYIPDEAYPFTPPLKIVNQSGPGPLWPRDIKVHEPILDAELSLAESFFLDGGRLLTGGITLADFLAKFKFFSQCRFFAKQEDYENNKPVRLITAPNLALSIPFLAVHHAFLKKTYDTSIRRGLPTKMGGFVPYRGGLSRLLTSILLQKDPFVAHYADNLFFAVPFPYQKQHQRSYTNPPYSLLQSAGLDRAEYLSLSEVERKAIIDEVTVDQKHWVWVSVDGASYESQKSIEDYLIAGWRIVAPYLNSKSRERAAKLVKRVLIWAHQVAPSGLALPAGSPPFPAPPPLVASTLTATDIKEFKEAESKLRTNLEGSEKFERQQPAVKPKFSSKPNKISDEFLAYFLVTYPLTLYFSQAQLGEVSLRVLGMPTGVGATFFYNDSSSRVDARHALNLLNQKDFLLRSKFLTIKEKEPSVEALFGLGKDEIFSRNGSKWKITKIVGQELGLKSELYPEEGASVVDVDLLGWSVLAWTIKPTVRSKPGSKTRTFWLPILQRARLLSMITFRKSLIRNPRWEMFIKSLATITNVEETAVHHLVEAALNIVVLRTTYSLGGWYHVGLATALQTAVSSELDKLDSHHRLVFGSATTSDAFIVKFFKNFSLVDFEEDEPEMSGFLEAMSSDEQSAVLRMPTVGSFNFVLSLLLSLEEKKDLMALLGKEDSSQLDESLAREIQDNQDLEVEAPIMAVGQEAPIQAEKSLSEEKIEGGKFKLQPKGSDEIIRRPNLSAFERMAMVMRLPSPCYIDPLPGQTNATMDKKQVSRAIRREISAALGGLSSEDSEFATRELLSQTLPPMILRYDPAVFAADPPIYTFNQNLSFADKVATIGKERQVWRKSKLPDAPTPIPVPPFENARIFPKTSHKKEEGADAPDDDDEKLPSVKVKGRFKDREVTDPTKLKAIRNKQMEKRLKERMEERNAKRPTQEVKAEERKVRIARMNARPEEIGPEMFVKDPVPFKVQKYIELDKIWKEHQTKLMLWLGMAPTKWQDDAKLTDQWKQLRAAVTKAAKKRGSVRLSKNDKIMLERALHPVVVEDALNDIEFKVTE